MNHQGHAVSRALLIGTGILGLWACGGDSGSSSGGTTPPTQDAQADSGAMDTSVTVDMTAPTPDATADAMPIVDAAPPAPDAAPPAPDAGLMVEVAQCDTPLGGHPWTNMVAESQPDFETDLDGVSIDALPDTIDISEMNGLFRGILAYALDIPPEMLGDTLEKADVLARGQLGRSAAAALALGLNDPGGIDFIFLRRGLQRYYHCDRNFPKTLDGFRATIFDYAAGEPQDVDSIAKCGIRRLTINEADGVYVAETLVDGAVRETEILLNGRRADGNLDFLIYNADGQLSDRTTFPTAGEGSEVMAGSPYVCTSCHMNRDRTPHTFGYETLFPEVGPCAQRQ